MNCKQFEELIDDLCGGASPPEQARAAQQHAACCTACAASLQAHRDLLAALKSLPAPAPAPGFAQRALRRAVAAKPRPRHGFVAGFASAAAILLAVVLWLPGGVPERDETPQVHLSLEVESNVNLVFNAAAAVDEARLSIMLPPHVELAGFQGQREISWTTSLGAGKNVLPLPLKATAAGDGLLTAHVETGKGRKTFRIRLDAGARPAMPARGA